MKPFLVTMRTCSLLLVALIPGPAISQSPLEPQDKAYAKLAEASQRFFEAKAVVEARYRKDLAEAITAGERIEVYLLHPHWEETDTGDSAWAIRLPEGEFPIIPYRAKTKILKKTVLTPEQRTELLPALQKVLGEAKPSGILCHYPVHGIRVFSGGNIRFQTSICWECRNFYVTYPDLAGWESTGNSGDLQKILAKLMPILEERKKKDGQ